MGDQCNNLWDEWDKWVDFAAQDELLGEPERIDGDCGLIGEASNAWKFIPETEGKCMAISIAGEIWVACGQLAAHADGDNNV